MNLFDDIIKANQPSGLIQGISFGIVADVSDPLQLQRIQVLDMTKGGQHRSDWLFRLLPFTRYSPPMPKINDLVVIGYVDGNPHKGCYLGVIENNSNKPVGADTDLTVMLGETKVSLDIQGNVVIMGAKKVLVDSQEVLLRGASKVTIQSAKVDIISAAVKIGGKDVVVVGGKDNRGDTIVDKGY